MLRPLARRSTASAVAVLALAAAPAALAQSTVQSFDGGGTPFTLSNFGGAAAAVTPGGPSGSFLRLAHAGIGSTLNTVAFDRTFTGAPTQIVADFDFRMGQGSRADGMALVLLNTGGFGTAGAGPAISEEGNAAGSLGIGFDIFNNGEPFGSNHVSLHFGGLLGNFDPGFDLADNQFHHAQLVVDFVVGGANVTLRLTPNGGATVTPIANLFVAGATAYESRAAFGARTGGANANHDLDNVFVDFVGGVNVVPEPATVVLLAGGLAVLGLAARRRPTA